jgi:hypothetical protein
MRRVVKPPPRVTPQIQETSPSAPVVSSYEIPQKSESLYPSDDPEWEALVQQEMAKIQSEFEKMAQQERYDPPRKDYPSEQPRQTSPMRNSEGYPREMYEDQTSASRAADYYPDLFDRPNHSLSPRRMKGGLNDLYGPDDDRQNMKAAKAAAYSHQVLIALPFCDVMLLNHSWNFKEINNTIIEMSLAMEIMILNLTDTAHRKLSTSNRERQLLITNGEIL